MTQAKSMTMARTIVTIITKSIVVDYGDYTLLQTIDDSIDCSLQTIDYSDYRLQAIVTIDTNSYDYDDYDYDYNYE